MYCIGWLYFVMATVLMIALGRNCGNMEYSNTALFNVMCKTVFCAALYSHWYLQLKVLEKESNA